MTPPMLAVLWHDLPDPDELDLGPDAFDTQAVVTVMSGEVTGELDRFVSLDADGGNPIVLYETRIDGLPDGAGIARIECDSARTLASLATVAGFLSHHMARLRGGDSEQHAIVFPTIEGGELTVDLAERSVAFGFGGATASMANQYARKLAQSITDQLST